MPDGVLSLLPSSLLLSRENGGIRASKVYPSSRSIRKVPLPFHENVISCSRDQIKKMTVPHVSRGGL